MLKEAVEDYRAQVSRRVAQAVIPEFSLPKAVGPEPDCVTSSDGVATDFRRFDTEIPSDPGT